ncbi:MAG: hypothetical protein EOP32_18155 [Rhodococcus sp. (in: high G+C Gram-positive bacteria)]|nr:MAG: hypothetical protein EOP32_18155 [Rhodococcus sp. (in: high G+C Gram-positive bacteria)]
MSTAGHHIEQHPDSVALRDQYDQAAENPISRVTDGLMLLAGLYAAASPWIIGFHGTTTLAVNDLIAGIAVALLAVGFTSAYGRTHGMAFTLPVVGLWLIISPWVVAGVDTTAGVVVSNVVAGAVVCVLGLGLTGLGLIRRAASYARRR